MKKYQIAVIGSAGSEEYPEGSIDFQKLYELSYQVGFSLGSSNCYVITGGKSGIMRGASEGARAAGGLSIGFVKGEKRGVSNEFVDIEIVTNMGYGGDAFLIPYSADGAIVIGGGSGTLKEISGFYTLGKPILVMKDSGGWAQRLSDQYLDERKTVQIIAVDNPKDAVENLLKLLL